MTSTTKMRTSGAAAKAVEELTGEFSGVRWRNPEGTFLIGTTREGVTVKGTVTEADTLLPGATYRFLGAWEESPQYGRQFKFNSFVQAEPHSRFGVVEYILRNTHDCGLGRATAEQIVDQFGTERATAAIREQPDEVARRTRLTPEQSVQASRQLKQVQRFEQTKIDLLDLFSGRGFPGELIGEVIKAWGIQAPRRIRRDPYGLLVRDFRGCGFARVDTLYRDLGLPLHRLKRQMLCAWHWLREQSFSSGSTWHTATAVETAVGELVSGELKFARAMELGIRSRWIAATRRPDGETWLAIREEAQAERECVEFLLELTSGEL